MMNLIKEIERCGFECIAGDLEQCQSWQQLKQGVKELIEYRTEH